MTTQFATINGHRLRYRLAGQGPLAVFGHGLLGSIEQLDAHHGGISRLQEHVRLLVYDARGHGQSEGPDDPRGYTWESLGLDMAALVEHAGERQAIIGGGSMGAATALWLAIERPEYVRALLLVMPPPLGFETMRGADEQQAIQVLDLLRTAVETFGLEKTIEMAKQFPGFAPTPEEADERARWLLSVNPKALLHAIRGLLSSPIHDPETYRRIAVPTLVVAHEGDPLHPVRAAKLVAEKVPGARLIVGPEPYYWRYHPDELNAEVTSFLAALG
jgi:pimeloyl-ACP methyl ester carboxylesterase